MLENNKTKEEAMKEMDLIYTSLKNNYRSAKAIIESINANLEMQYGSLRKMITEERFELESSEYETIKMTNHLQAYLEQINNNINQLNNNCTHKYIGTTINKYTGNKECVCIMCGKVFTEQK